MRNKKEKFSLLVGEEFLSKDDLLLIRGGDRNRSCPINNVAQCGCTVNTVAGCETNTPCTVINKSESCRI